MMAPTALMRATVRDEAPGPAALAAAYRARCVASEGSNRCATSLTWPSQSSASHFLDGCLEGVDDSIPEVVDAVQDAVIVQPVLAGEAPPGVVIDAGCIKGAADLHG